MAAEPGFPTRAEAETPFGRCFGPIRAHLLRKSDYPRGIRTACGLLHSRSAFGIGLPLPASDRRHLGCGCSSVVEHDLAKVGVEGSSPFARSRFSRWQSAGSTKAAVSGFVVFEPRLRSAHETLPAQRPSRLAISHVGQSHRLAHDRPDCRSASDFVDRADPAIATARANPPLWNGPRRCEATSRVAAHRILRCSGVEKRLKRTTGEEISSQFVLV